MSFSKIVVSFMVLAIFQSTAVPARAAEPLADKVRTSIDKGIHYLKKTQENRGREWNWENSGLLNAAWQGGTTYLATLALLTSGVPVTDPVIQRTLPYVRALKPQQTYVLALQAMVLAEVGEVKDLSIIQNNVNLLLEGRIYNGKDLIGWSYNKGGHIQSDNSNTQYALLGLLAGRQAGVKIAQADWEEIQSFYIRTQDKSKTKSDGGWGYHPLVARESTHTMTTAGLSGLFISGLELNIGKQKLDETTGVADQCGKYEENEAVARGLNWLGANFKFDLSGTQGQSTTFYNIYGIERVGRLSGQRFIGNHDWYREGCELLCGVDKNSPLAQQPDGSWQSGQNTIDKMPVLSTSFALLFLAKGRTPILISKLAFDGPNNNRNDWNRKHHDARHLVDYASKHLFKKQPLAWQIFDPRSADFSVPERLDEELKSLLQSPILYMNGHVAPKLTNSQVELLRRYVDEGGLIFAEACCGSKDFAEGFRDLMEKVFKKDGAALEPLSLEHPVWTSHMPIDPKEFTAGRNEREWIQGIERGCKTVVIFSPQPLAGFWEEAKFMPQNNLPPTTRGELAYRFAGNVIAYATGLEMPKPRLTPVALIDRSDAKNVTRHALKLAQLKHDGDWKPAPQAMRILANYLIENYGLQVTPMRSDDPDVRPGNLNELLQYKFMYMHGRREFTMEANQITNLRNNLRTGATLFADACCGSKEFDKAFRNLAAQLYPDKKLEPIPLEDELYSEQLNGKAISIVKCRRETASGTAAEFEDIPPQLEGVKVGKRWAIIYSKYDIGCALEKNKSSACRGYNHESAKILGAAAVLYSLKK